MIDGFIVGIIFIIVGSLVFPVAIEFIEIIRKRRKVG